MVPVNIGKIPLELEFAGSCNCCYGCCMSSNTVMYINKDNQVEVFDFKKSVDYKRDQYRSINRLWDFTTDYHEALRELGGIDITQMDKLTLSEIRKVNEVMRRMQEVWERETNKMRRLRESHIRIRR